MTRPAAWALGTAFLLVHLVLGWINVADPLHVNPAGDVTGVYRFWIDYWHTNGVLVGVDTSWVYPIAALLPMLAADAFGDAGYLVTWLLLVTVLDGIALLLLARRRPALAWWWLAAIALLGPVALSRLDGVAIPIAVLGVLAAADRPGLAAAIWTAAAWIKVWPAVLVAALLVAVRRPVRVLGAAAAVSVAVIVVALALGAGPVVFSFVTEQAGRGVQVEAPIALPWLWSAAFGGGTSIYYDTSILTFQVRGDGVPQAAAAMTPVLLIGVAAVVGAGLLARRRGGEQAEVLALTALGLVSAVIALNKVGSPQYLTWYVAPVLLGLLTVPRSFRFPAVVVLVMTGLTQVIYPWFYGGVTGATPWVLAVLTVRNLLELVLLGWSVARLGALRSAVVPLDVGRAVPAA